jgi:hypothetical protein
VGHALNELVGDPARDRPPCGRPAEIGGSLASAKPGLIEQGPAQPKLHGSRLAARTRKVSGPKMLCNPMRIRPTVSLHGVGAAVKISAFNEWRLDAGHYYSADPYYFCLDYCLRTLILGLFEFPLDEGVTIYCDQEKEHELIGRDIALWHEARLRRYGPSQRQRDRVINTYYVSSFKYVPIRAADILAHSTFQWARDYLKDGKVDEPFFLQCLRQRYVIATQYFLIRR